MNQDWSYGILCVKTKSTEVICETIDIEVEKRMFQVRVELGNSSFQFDEESEYHEEDSRVEFESSEEELSGDDSPDDYSDEEIDETFEESIIRESSPEIESNYHARDEFINFFNKEINRPTSSEEKLVFLEKGGINLINSDQGENILLDTQIHKCGSPSHFLVDLQKDGSTGPKEIGIDKTQKEKSPTEEKENFIKNSEGIIDKTGEINQLKNAGIETGERRLKGLTEKMKALLSPDTPL
ncbi:hypothetical protein L2E82_30774 [Cichorium intybus]|uniref:Uncharacterized protein n=1 Tax=Cichorium intybus TaxID=13427 RepID=A0ACB9D1J2_CICIN|nr:hypothetical protein L2E82_30774 [Cichorium intybus]